MNFDPSPIINRHTPERLSAVSGFPIRTLYRWRQKKAVAGTGTAQQLRIDQLRLAAAALEADDPKPRKAKRRAA